MERRKTSGKPSVEVTPSATQSTVQPTEQLTVARDYFSKELGTVIDRRRVQVPPDAFEYLVTLLVQHLHSEVFFSKTPDGKLGENYLVQLYAEYLRGNAEVKKTALQRLGDVCLMVTGCFSDSLSRKLVDIEYYQGMGGAAYWQRAQIASKEGALFQDLSVRFKVFSGLLMEMSDRSSLNNNKDVLRIYERWLQTKSLHLKEILSEKGIPTPVEIDPKQKN